MRRTTVHELSAARVVAGAIEAGAAGAAARAGCGLAVRAGAAAASAADAPGGVLTLAAGVSTGTGDSMVVIQAPSIAAETSRSQNLMSDRVWIPGTKNAATSSGVSTKLFSVRVGADDSFAFHLEWALHARTPRGAAVYAARTTCVITGAGAAIGVVESGAVSLAPSGAAIAAEVTTTTADHTVTVWLTPTFVRIAPDAATIDYVATFTGNAAVTPP